MSTTGSLDVFKSIPCFTRLSPDALERLLGLAEEQSFKKGEIIILEDEACPGLFVVKSGSVKLYRTSITGDEQIVRIVGRGGCFECAPVFDDGPNPVSAQALEPSTLLVIPAAEFRSVISAYPEALLGIVSILSMRLRALLNMVEDFSFRGVHSRLAKLLLQLSEQVGDELTVSPSQLFNQQDLACILGCSRQIVNNSLRRMTKDGIIKMDGRRIIILDPDALRRIS